MTFDLSSIHAFCDARCLTAAQRQRRCVYESGGG